MDSLVASDLTSGTEDDGKARMGDLAMEEQSIGPIGCCLIINILGGIVSSNPAFGVIWILSKKKIGFAFSKRRLRQIGLNVSQNMEVSDVSGTTTKNTKDGAIGTRVGALEGDGLDLKLIPSLESVKTLEYSRGLTVGRIQRIGRIRAELERKWGEGIGGREIKGNSPIKDAGDAFDSVSFVESISKRNVALQSGFADTLGVHGPPLGLSRRTTSLAFHHGVK